MDQPCYICDHQGGDEGDWVAMARGAAHRNCLDEARVNPDPNPNPNPPAQRRRGAMYWEIAERHHFRDEMLDRFLTEVQRSIQRLKNGTASEEERERLFQVLRASGMPNAIPEEME